MSEFVEYLLLALGGYATHLLKMYIESLKRNEVFIKKIFIASVALNMISILLLTYVGDTLPPEIYVPSPLGAIMVGIFGSSMLSGVVNIKKPIDIVDSDTAVIKPKKEM